MNNCRCGDSPKIKGLCKKCYFQDYYKEANKNIVKKRVGRPSRNYENTFLNVLNKVKEGFNIYQACEETNENRQCLYKIMTVKQKKELKRFADLNKKQ